PPPEFVEPKAEDEPETAVQRATPAAEAEKPAEKPPEPAPSATPPPSTTEVTVHGRVPPPSRGASDFHVSVGALDKVPRKNATELLKLAPGIFLSNEGGEGHAEQVF